MHAQGRCLPVARSGSERWWRGDEAHEASKFGLNLGAKSFPNSTLPAVAQQTKAGIRGRVDSISKLCTLESMIHVETVESKFYGFYRGIMIPCTLGSAQTRVHNTQALWTLDYMLPSGIMNSLRVHCAQVLCTIELPPVHLTCHTGTVHACIHLTCHTGTVHACIHLYIYIFLLFF